MSQTTATTSAVLAPHPDRLFPADPATRTIARAVYQAVADAPVISPHGHVDAAMIAADQPFPDPAALLVTPDHYVLRLLHANGVPLDALCRWWRACRRSRDLAPSRRTLGRLPRQPRPVLVRDRTAPGFGLDQQPSATNADAQYDRIASALLELLFCSCALFDAFGIEVLATTDDPTADLAAHAQLAADPTFRGRVVPTFRADVVFDLSRPDWRTVVASIGQAAGDRHGHP